ncbi:MAG: polysaccharide export protein [Acidobacteriota bacterium]|nr:polysaccharide export protein [Acidobacteriota bacterium]
MRKVVKQIFITALMVLGVFSAVTAFAQDKSDTKQTDSNKINPALLGRNAQDENARKYRIGVGDEIIVEVFKHPEYSVIRRVNERGVIALPRIEQPIQAVCKTENELSEEIASYYKKYLRQPFVNVYVKDYKSQPVAVMGAVDKPGPFFISRQMTLIQAISLAGGPTKEAGSKVLVARMGDVNLCSLPDSAAGNTTGEGALKGKFYTYNLRRVMEGDNSANPLMEPGDIVSILEADRAYVIGNVKEQKTILLKEPRTLTQAIAEAGGVDTSTKMRQIFILRQDENGNKSRIPYDMLAINSGKEKDPFLLPNDIVEVPTDPKKSNLETLKKALFNGLPAVIPFLF